MQMRNGFVVAGLTLLCLAVPVQGQSSDSALYARAQQMVSNGEGAAGRALIDSLLGATPTGSQRYAEALYWQATLAGSPADAERSYRQIVVDYPLSPRVDAALLQMGQLELARGDREAALQHFQRLAVEHPNSPLRAKGSYYLARAYFEKNDLVRGCKANADALAHARPSDVELKNQIEFQNQRCKGVATTAPATTQTASAEDAVEASEEEIAEPVVDTPATHDAKPASKTVPVKSAPAKASVKKGAVKAVKAAAKPGTTKPAVTDDSEVSDAETPASETAKPVKNGTVKYAVQVAAFYDQSQATALATKLRGRGYAAHVDGTAAPFRVRVGHYATRAQAVTALENMKAKKITGFVTQE